MYIYTKIKQTDENRKSKVSRERRSWKIKRDKLNESELKKGIGDTKMQSRKYKFITGYESTL